jgi:monoamine oxidase
MLALHASYDCIVVGAGISGLWMAREILKEHPEWSVALAERYKGLGGRTYSYSPPGFPGVSWEMGAGRVRSDHRMVLDLLREYSLTWAPIGGDIAFVSKNGAAPQENLFESVMVPMYFEPLRRLSPETLAKHTIEELLTNVVGSSKTKELLAQFPYRAEVTTLRADLALKQFLGGGEMSGHSGYGVVAEGFSELIRRMREDIEKRGCVILNRHRLVDIQKGPAKATDLKFEFGPGKGHITLRAKRACVLALHKDAVAEIRALKNIDALRFLKTQPLLRCYAIFKNTWFEDLPRIVTPERPRYILPIDKKRGVIMISYTDSDDTREYVRTLNKSGEAALEKLILEDVRKLFPERDIEKPLFFRPHAWETGATYWLPGDYSPEEESVSAVHPLPEKFPGLWLCGESWSMRQAWVEGALEHAKVCLHALKKTLN